MSSVDLPSPTPAAVRALAPTGHLRAAINMSNFLLVTDVNSVGDPVGVSPDMAGALAVQLGVELELIRYDSPGQAAEDAEAELWDIVNIGSEPVRAAKIAFTSAYCEIEATYLVTGTSPITSIGEVDQHGVRIASASKSAYGLWLDRHISHAEIVNAQGLDGSFDTFLAMDLDVLAGLRPRLIQDAAQIPGARILDGCFTSVQQSIGTPRSHDESGVNFLIDFVEAAKRSGLVRRLIAAHRVQGLTVAAPR